MTDFIVFNFFLILQSFYRIVIIVAYACTFCVENVCDYIRELTPTVISFTFYDNVNLAFVDATPEDWVAQSV